MNEFLEDKCPCGCYLRVGKRKYCTKKCYNKYNKHNSYNSKKLKAEKMKVYLAAKLGSKCSKCGYDKNMNALSFVHNDESKKLFPITITTLSNKSQLSLSREVSKCNLVCLNCQAELSL